MNSTIDTMNLANGFQPAIDLRDREATEENGLLIIGPGLVFAAYITCTYVLRGSIVWSWPYGLVCRF